jgi:hypothetical protein
VRANYIGVSWYLKRPMGSGTSLPARDRAGPGVQLSTARFSFASAWSHC